MTARQRNRIPPPQVLAACILVVSALIVFVSSPTPLGGVVLLFALMLAWLLALGSRTGWTLVLLGSVLGLLTSPSHSGGSPGIMATALTIACLLAPSSLRYTWREIGIDSWSARSSVQFNALCGRLLQGSYGFLARVAGWSGNEDQWGRSYDLLAWRLGGLALFLLFPLTLADRWEKASHTSIADGLARVIWLGWAIAVVAFLVTLTRAALQHARTRRRQGS
jgi:hypothetical protein